MEHHPTARPAWPALSLLAPLTVMWIGAPAAIACACVYGLPVHAVVGLYVMINVTGFGVTMGFHRLFTHRSFETSRTIERALMIFGCMSGQSSPCFWIAEHRRHHRHSDRPGDPHSPHASGTHGWWRRFWHAHQGWTLCWASYDPTAVRDIMKRPDLAWIDRYWYAWYLLGLAIPAGVGYLIGGTAYDALIGLLWGGVLRHALNQHTTYLINSVGHLWGSRPYDTGEHSRNNLLLGLLALGEGWHNNHHAHPYSARHGFYWWQSDLTWTVLWLMERVGLVWNVKRPKLDPPTPKTAPEVSVTDAAAVGATGGS